MYEYFFLPQALKIIKELYDIPIDIIFTGNQPGGEGKIIIDITVTTL